MLKHISFALAIALLLSSCSSRVSLMKRRYTKGYYLSSGRNPQLKHLPTANKHLPNQTQNESVPTIFVHANESLTLPNTKENAAYVNTGYPPQKTEIATVTFAPEHNQSQKNLEAERKFETHIKVNPAPDADPDVKLVLLFVLALLIPPLAIYLKNNAVNQWFWITLVLCLLSLLVFFFRLGGLLWLVSIILAILYIFGAI